MAKQLPKRMRLKAGVYYFISFDGRWRALGRDFVRALENYLALYGDSCTTEIRDAVANLYLEALGG